MKMRMSVLLASLALYPALGWSESATTPTSVVEMNQVDALGVGKSIGTITLSDSKDGLLVTPKLTGLSQGEHGFHVHTNPDCGPKEKDGKMSPAEAAGGHLDPEKTGKHSGPGGGGHKGDLPKLIVEADGTASKAVTVKGLTLAAVKNHSVMIHASGDNYSDLPMPLGGGGTRIACGVVK